MWTYSSLKTNCDITGTCKSWLMVSVVHLLNVKKEWIKKSIHWCRKNDPNWSLNPDDDKWILIKRILK